MMTTEVVSVLHRGILMPHFSLALGHRRLGLASDLGHLGLASDQLAPKAT